MELSRNGNYIPVNFDYAVSFAWPSRCDDYRLQGLWYDWAFTAYWSVYVVTGQCRGNSLISFSRLEKWKGFQGWHNAMFVGSVWIQKRAKRLCRNRFHDQRKTKPAHTVFIFVMVLLVQYHAIASALVIEPAMCHFDITVKLWSLMLKFVAPPSTLIAFPSNFTAHAKHLRDEIWVSDYIVQIFVVLVAAAKSNGHTRCCRHHFRKENTVCASSTWCMYHSWRHLSVEEWTSLQNGRRGRCSLRSSSRKYGCNSSNFYL